MASKRAPPPQPIEDDEASSSTSGQEQIPQPSSSRGKAKQPRVKDKDTPYDEYSRQTNISVATLKREVDPRYWTDRINLDNISPESEDDIIQLNSFAGCAIAELRTTSATGSLFAQFFLEDFQDWTINHWSRVNRAFKRELENLLQLRGVYPVSDTKASQAQKLYDIAHWNFGIDNTKS